MSFSERSLRHALQLCKPQARISTGPRLDGLLRQGQPRAERVTIRIPILCVKIGKACSLGGKNTENSNESDVSGTTLAPTSAMMRCLSVAVGIAVLGGCPREPAQPAVDPTSAAPAPPQSGVAPGATGAEQGAAPASTPQPAPSPPNATASPANPAANTNNGSGTKTPSSTQARDTPAPAQVPNAMPQPDPL